MFKLILVISKFVFVVVHVESINHAIRQKFSLKAPWVIGWSHYTMDYSYLFCSVEWDEKSFNVMSYNVCIFIFIFILPLIALTFTNVKVIVYVSK